MGSLVDLIKDIPHVAVLRDKVLNLEAQKAALETEIAILKDDLREAQAENKRLKQEIESLTHTDDLQEIEVKLLIRLASERRENYAQLLKTDLQLNQTRLDYLLQALTEKKYIYFYGLYMSSDPGEYHLTQKGREYLIKNNLI